LTRQQAKFIWRRGPRDNAAETETPRTLATALVIAGRGPGQKGTKKLHAEHGDALVCVRYRYDKASRTRYKTIELIVEKTAWQPPARKFRRQRSCSGADRIRGKKIDGIREGGERQWNPEQQLWFVKYDKIARTALEKHIPVDACIYM
jgi:hypothetical protein